MGFVFALALLAFCRIRLWALRVVQDDMLGWLAAGLRLWGNRRFIA